MVDGFDYPIKIRYVILMIGIRSMGGQLNDNLICYHNVQNPKFYFKTDVTG